MTCMVSLKSKALVKNFYFKYYTHLESSTIQKCLQCTQIISTVPV